MESGSVQAVRCLYCWAVTPWWECGCEDARVAREDGVGRPEVRDGPGGRMVVVLPAHVVERHRAAKGRLERYRASREINGDLDAVPEQEAEAPEEARPDRKAYMRELMRKRRAKGRAA